ncbi:MAG TPA: PDZ domain-containing protein [Longimicrobium sp.]|nr:PDZ domain-containing protein [Longimicrobium sp.]
MKTRNWLAALVALALALPGALSAQDRPGDERRTGGGYMGILFGWDEQGRAEVRDVVPGSPADRAGVRRGDEVVRLNGRTADEDAVDDLREELDSGETVRIVLRRDGREEERTIVAGPRPDRMVYRVPREGPGGVFTIPPGDRRIVIRMDTLEMHMDSLLTRMDSLRGHLRSRHGDSLVIRFDTLVRVMRDSLMRSVPRLEGRLREGLTPFFMEFGPRSMAGAEFAEMNAGLGRYFRTNEGLLVLQVGPETPAGRAGLQPGDVVVEANGSRVTRVGQLREAFVRADGQEVRLTVMRDGRRQQVPVRWDGARGTRFRVENAERIRAGERVRVRTVAPARARTAEPTRRPHN